MDTAQIIIESYNIPYGAVVKDGKRQIMEHLKSINRMNDDV